MERLGQELVYEGRELLGRIKRAGHVYEEVLIRQYVIVLSKH